MISEATETTGENSRTKRAAMCFREGSVHTFKHVGCVMQCVMFDVTIIRAYDAAQGWHEAGHKGCLVTMRQWVDGISIAEARCSRVIQCREHETDSKFFEVN